MRPTLRQLQYFTAVAEHGHVGRAATACGVSQPSLSAQLKTMEAELGTPLFERGRQGAIATPAGRELLPRARLILRDVEAFKATARQSAAGGKLSGRLRLGVLPSVGPYLLPTALHRLHADNPDLRLEVREGLTGELSTCLQDGRLDLIVCTDPGPEAETHAILRENIYICVAPDDPLATGGAAVKLSEIAGRSLLSLGGSRRLGRLVARFAEEAGARVDGEYVGSSLDAIRQMAAMGSGVAILPSLYAISEAKRDPDLVVRRIDHAEAYRNIALGWRRTSTSRDAFAEIGRVLKRVAAELMA